MIYQRLINAPKKKDIKEVFLKVNLELLYANEIDSGPSESFVQFWLHNMLNSRKSVRWSAVPVPCLSRLWLKLRGSRAAAPKGSMTYAFTHMGNFLLLLRTPPPPSLQAYIPASRPKSQS